MPNTDHTETIATEILTDLSLREKHIIAHMDEGDIVCLTCKFSQYLSAKAPGSDSKERIKIMKRIWAKLYESHRLKILK